MVREKIQHWQARSTQVSWKSFPLLTRGWVLQERHLSPRTLHFCSHELVWECLENLTCECGGILADCDPLGRLQLVANTAVPVDLQPSLSVIDGSGQTPDQNVDFQNLHSEVSARNHAELEYNHVTAGMHAITPSIRPSDPEPNSDVTFGRRDKRSRSWTRATEILSTSMQCMKRRLPGSNHNLHLSERLGDQSDGSTRTDRWTPNSLSPDAAHHQRSILFTTSMLEADLVGALKAHGEIASLQPPRYEEVFAKQRQTQNWEHILDQWHSIVGQYSSLKLTEETDRLPALSGLAMLASSILGTYSCGLWLKTIASDLLWRVPLLEHGYGRPTEFTGPSWSWASVNGPVAYWNDLNDHTEDDEIERLQYDMNTLETWYERKEAKKALRRRLQEQAARRQKPPKLEAKCKVTLTGENPFGEVSSGRLKIRGFVRNARLVYGSYYGSAESTYADRHDPLEYQLRIHTSHSNDRSFDLELPFFADYILSEGSDGVPEDALVTLFCLQQNVCLVLTGGRGEYRRIGIVRQPSGYRSLYGLNWMSESSIEVITIV